MRFLDYLFCVKCPVRRSNKDTIIAYLRKKGNIPLSKSDFIAVYRKKNRSVRHEYLTLASKHSDMGAFMFTFTSSISGTYSKLRLINEIKSYVTYLIANSKAEIYFFSNIELGHSLTNPHLHTQIWCDDKNAVQLIYEKIIAKFSLDEKRCSLSEPQQQPQHYNYVIKDYAETLTDERIWKLEQTKKKYRKQLGLKLRFYSRSKSKYQSKLYKIVYHTYGVLRALADDWIDFFINTFFVRRELRESLLKSKKSFFLFSFSSFISILRTRALGCLMSKFVFFRRLFRRSLDILFLSPANSPPFSVGLLDFKFKGDVLFLLCFILFSITLTVYRLLWVLWVGLFSDLIIICLLFTIVLFVEVRCLSPPVFFMLEKK